MSILCLASFLLSLWSWTDTATSGRELVVVPGAQVPLGTPSPGATLEAGIEGEVLGRGATAGYVAPQRGAHWLAVAQRDASGHVSVVRWTRLRVDSEPPQLTWAVVGASPLEAAGRRAYAPPVTLEAAAYDAGSGVAALEWSAEGMAWQPLAGAITAAAYNLRIRARDGAGNEREVDTRASVDDEPPVLELMGAAGTPASAEGFNVGADESLRLRAADRGTPLTRFIVTLDGIRWFRVSGSQLEFRLPRGAHLVGGEAEDALGHFRRTLWHVHAGRER